MNIYLMGQCTLHWGRMEFGNIGNYYIIEPLIRELYRVFPDSSITTTFQMSEDFCRRERITVVPIDRYYGWKNDDIDVALAELAAAELFSKTGYLPQRTPFVDDILASDLVIDFSGDMWGDNANFLGPDRFMIGLCKDRVAQLLGKPTVMLAGSPGPFDNQELKKFAMEVYANFDLVTNREPISMNILAKEGFDITKTKNQACPAFLFEPNELEELQGILSDVGLIKDCDKPNVGFIICGWNFQEGPFDKEDREDREFTVFAEAVEHIEKEIGANVFLISHSNGFPVPPSDFKLIHGRDYYILERLYDVVRRRGIAKNVKLMTGVYDTWQTKGVIGNFDMLVSGRVHGSVAGISQNVPTVLIDYGHEPKAHKIRGFAQVAGVEAYLADPSSENDVIKKIDMCWANYEQYKKTLCQNNPHVKKNARENFDLLRDMI